MTDEQAIRAIRQLPPGTNICEIFDHEEMRVIVIGGTSGGCEMTFKIDYKGKLLVQRELHDVAALLLARRRRSVI